MPVGHWKGREPLDPKVHVPIWLAYLVHAVCNILFAGLGRVERAAKEQLHCLYVSKVLLQINCKELIG